MTYSHDPKFGIHFMQPFNDIINSNIWRCTCKYFRLLKSNSLKDVFNHCCSLACAWWPMNHRNISWAKTERNCFLLSFIQTSINKKKFISSELVGVIHHLGFFILKKYINESLIFPRAAKNCQFKKKLTYNFIIASPGPFYNACKWFH